LRPLWVFAPHFVMIKVDLGVFIYTIEKKCMNILFSNKQKQQTLLQHQWLVVNTQRKKRHARSKSTSTLPNI
jgi:hypothetical protein